MGDHLKITVKILYLVQLHLLEVEVQIHQEHLEVLVQVKLADRVAEVQEEVILHLKVHLLLEEQVILLLKHHLKVKMVVMDILVTLDVMEIKVAQEAEEDQLDLVDQVFHLQTQLIIKEAEEMEHMDKLSLILSLVQQHLVMVMLIHLILALEVLQVAAEVA